MNDIAIKVENLGKRYRIGKKPKPAPTVLGKVAHACKLPFTWLIDQIKEPSEDEVVWALRDVSFEVKRGEVVGIIGRNGAGKSTLLKLLSRITEPTEGRAEIHGRVGSLLEVGTGMHAELTGRENIYMNGTVLGMTKREIDAKFDEIIDFSGVERFIDTPIKRYSSGMKVRLGFAIAAHLEPEILIVDEVLAVGDAEFQKKCLNKMEDVAGHGRTVLFVSHNMASVKSLCQKCYLLVNGYIKYAGDVDYAVKSYLKGDHHSTNFKKWDNPEIVKNNFELIEIGIIKKGADYKNVMRVNDELEFSAKYNIINSSCVLHLTLHIKDEQGNKLFSTSWSKNGISYEHQNGEYVAKAYIPANFFNWGSYYIDLLVVENRKNVIIFERDILSFTLTNKEKQIGSWMGREPGSITPSFKWMREKIN